MKPYLWLTSRLPGGLARFGIAWPLVAGLRAWYWVFGLLDSAIQRPLRRIFGTRYERVGACKQTGVCCELIRMEPPGFSWRRPRVLSFFIRFGEVMYPFRYLGISEKNVVYTCDNFDEQARQCKNYRFRPKVCRDYPYVGFFSRPSFFKGCGFGIRLRSRQPSFVEAMDLRRRENAAPPGIELLPVPPQATPEEDRSP